MLKILKEMYYRYKVRKYNLSIIKLTKLREAIKAKQKTHTDKSEAYNIKLRGIL